MKKHIARDYLKTFLIVLALVLLTCEYLDFQAPEIAIMSPKEGESYFRTLPCEFEVTDNQTVKKVEVFIGVLSVHIFTEKPYVADIDISKFPVGSTVLKVQAHDQAGNWSETEREFEIVWETISAPDDPSGPDSGYTDSTYIYTTGGATSSLGHSLEYRFNWDSELISPADYSDWSSTSSASHSWDSAGTYNVKSQARCTIHTSITSDWSSAKTVTISEPTETISTPVTPSGPTSGETNTSYTCTTGGATSSLGHSVEYRFDWGDGNYSTWSSSTSASHTWNSPGIYSVKAQARCTIHTSVLSGWSNSLNVSFSEPTETISTPDIPSGPSSGEINTSYTYGTGGATSNLGHSVEYRFDWGDGTYSSWSSATSASHTWSSPGTYSVKAQARCATHTNMVSNWSSAMLMTIGPWQPALVGSYDTPGLARDVFVSGSYAYVADWDGLEVINVSDPASPTLAGSFDTPRSAYGVAMSGGYAYVANGDSGLQVIDVSNSASPYLAGSYDTPDYAQSVFVVGGCAYVSDTRSGLQVIDVSNPASPFLASSYNTPGFVADVFVTGGYAYAADGDSGLKVIDVSNPASPFLVGSYDTPDIALGVYVLGDYAYVADGHSGLQVIDVSNPASPFLAGIYDTPDYARGVFVSGNYAYIADRNCGLQIIDVSNPASPAHAGRYNTLDVAEDVHVTGNYAYLANFTRGLLIIDVSGLP